MSTEDQSSAFFIEIDVLPVTQAYSNKNSSAFFVQFERKHAINSNER